MLKRFLLKLLLLFFIPVFHAKQPVWKKVSRSATKKYLVKKKNKNLYSAIVGSSSLGIILFGLVFFIKRYRKETSTNNTINTASTPLEGEMKNTQEAEKTSGKNTTNTASTPLEDEIKNTQKAEETSTNDTINTASTPLEGEIKNTQKAEEASTNNTINTPAIPLKDEIKNTQKAEETSTNNTINTPAIPLEDEINTMYNSFSEKTNQALKPYKIKIPKHIAIYKCAAQYLEDIEKKQKIYRLTAVTGSPGVGKTFISLLMKKYLESKNEKVYFVGQDTCVYPGILKNEYYSLIIIDDLTFDENDIIEERTNYGDGRQPPTKYLSIPITLEVLAKWNQECINEKMHLWITSNIYNFQEYMLKMKKILDAYTQYENDPSYEYIFNFLSAITQPGEKKNVQYIEIQSESLRTGLIGIFGNENTVFNEDEFNLVKSKFSLDATPIDGGTIFVPNNTVPESKDINLVYAGHESGLIYYAKKKSKIFLIKDILSNEKLQDFMRACYDEGCLLIIEVNTNEHAKEIVKKIQIRLSSLLKSSKRGAKVGDLDRLRISILYRAARNS